MGSEHTVQLCTLEAASGIKRKPENTIYDFLLLSSSFRYEGELETTFPRSNICILIDRSEPPRSASLTLLKLFSFIHFPFLELSFFLRLIFWRNPLSKKRKEEISLYWQRADTLSKLLFDGKIIFGLSFSPLLIVYECRIIKKFLIIFLEWRKWKFLFALCLRGFFFSFQQTIFPRENQSSSRLTKMRKKKEKEKLLIRINAA